MEKFKAVEKAMKTKAYSKEGLSAQAKLDPKEKAKFEAAEFLNNMVEELERQIETLEAEGESIQATLKRGKKSDKADRMAEIERITERHKWHQCKLELIKRSLENGAVNTEQVTDLEESIKYYVSEGMNDDYMGEDDEMYDDLNLQEEEDVYGMNNDNDRVSSQDNASIQDEPESHAASIPKPKSVEPVVAVARRPSMQLKSPLPALATLHSPMSNMANGSTNGSFMKPAPAPTRPPGETLKYASAAAAAAANVGIAPLPPPPSTGMTPPAYNNTPLASIPSHLQRESPVSLSSPPASAAQTPAQKSAVPARVEAQESTSRPSRSPAPSTRSASIPPIEKLEPVPKSTRKGKARQTSPSKKTNGIKKPEPVEEEEESHYHLPSDLDDLVESFKINQSRAGMPPSESALRMLESSQSRCPDSLDSEAPRSYRPKNRFETPSWYPQEPLPVFDDPRLFSRIDPDTLFYVFYYQQNTYQQYLAAKALKDQSWRFHKQYQTWFQRHEEPKTITEEFEQGTYRFFDYESTWLVCRSHLVKDRSKTTVFTRNSDRIIFHTADLNDESKPTESYRQQVGVQNTTLKSPPGFERKKKAMTPQVGEVAVGTVSVYDAFSTAVVKNAWKTADAQQAAVEMANPQMSNVEMALTKTDPYGNTSSLVKQENFPHQEQSKYRPPSLRAHRDPAQRLGPNPVRASAITPTAEFWPSGVPFSASLKSAFPLHN